MSTCADDVAPGGLDDARAVIAGLNAVALLGSFMHAVGDPEKVADLAAGGLTALTRAPLAAIAWRSAAPEESLRVRGSFAGSRTLPVPLAEGLDQLCADLPQHRPTWLAIGRSAGPLRRAGLTDLFALPLRVSHQFLGFLLAAGAGIDLPTDLTLVRVLGAQTSTALYVARLHSVEAARAEEMAELAAGLQLQTDLLSRALRLQEELLDLVLHGKDARAILEHLGRAIGAPVWLLDDECQVMSSWTAPEADRTDLPGAAELRRGVGRLLPGRGPQTVEMVTRSGQMRSFLAQHVSTDRETFGYLLVGSTVLGPVDQGVFQGGRLVLALRLLAERSVAEAEDRLGRELLADALRSRGGGPAVAAVAGRLGYVDRGPAVVVVARPAPLPATGRRAEESARRALGQELAAAGQVLAGPLGDDVVAIARPEALAGLSRRVDELVAALAPDLDLRVGVSDVDPQMRDLARAHREATAAAALAARASVRLLRFTDLGLHRLMFDVAKPDRVDEHVERWIGPLLRYDAAQRANLVDTLARFLRCGNQVESARELSIHPSTLKYRLGRIREILGVDFLAADARFNIELALRLRESAAFMADHHTG